jgi:hypothetical protein
VIVMRIATLCGDIRNLTYSYVLSRASSLILLRPFMAEQITFFIPLFYEVLSYFSTSKSEMKLRPITQHKRQAVKA